MVCAMRWIAWLLRQKGQLHDPLIGYTKAGKIVPLTYSELSDLLKTWVRKLGLDDSTYTLHGLRRGGTNHALTVGICGEDVQLMGDWKSNAYMQYIA